jgi:pimeloyl-ACP methyl ester carboxylesterase
MKCLHVTLVALGVVARLTAQQPDIGPAPGTVVDVGGRKLHLLCRGEGSPTVVLEAGASAFAIDWTLVQQQVARTNRVCAYDRAGMGWSDPPTPGTPRSVSADLHELLRAAGERAPFVLVGASLGGLHVRSYAADYPDDVVGLVLVDPTSEDRLFTMIDGQAVLIGSLTADQMRATVPTQTIRVPRRPPQTGAPFDKLPAPLYELRVKLDTRLIASIPDSVTPLMIATSREEERVRLARLLAQRSSTPHPLGDRPLVVLSRGVDSDPEPRATHAALAKLSTNSRHTVVPGSGHEIHLFEPAAVVQAIADVVRSARTKARLSSGIGNREP